MRHNVFGKQLNRDTGQRKALVRGLAGAIIRSEAIETTEAKAEAAKGLIEKLITMAKRAKITDLREIEATLLNKDLVEKLVHEIAPRFETRPGGYLRLVKLGNRVGDNAPMVRMELTPSSPNKSENNTTGTNQKPKTGNTNKETQKASSRNTKASSKSIK